MPDIIHCGDCSAQDPEWASLNRGLLLCKDCCYVHRTLGPQYSRVKSIKNVQWDPNLKKMLFTLANGPANHVWEYTLLTEKSKSDLHLKPSSNDSVEKKKRKFIIAKHLHCQFINRQKSDSASTELHSTVRTGDIGTSLRLLVAGGDPNYFHPIMGTRPLHVAAKSGQSLQVELLFLYGAQTDGLDYLGQTPVEHATKAGHKELALRILQLRYDLTDKLAHFVCSQMPDHSGNKHVIIPKDEITCASRQQGEQQLRNQQDCVIEQLAADLYDEVDRRQVESVLLETIPSSEVPKYSIAFLPVHSHFPSVRNQTRQKFARLTNEELGSLISLVLAESKRRHFQTVAADFNAEKDIFTFMDMGKSAGSLKTNELVDDDFPLYDSVASDDEVLVTEEQRLSRQRSVTEISPVNTSNMNPISNCDGSHVTENRRLSSKLLESETKVRELNLINDGLKQEVEFLRNMSKTVILENLELKLKHFETTKNATILTNGIHKSDNPAEIFLKTRPPRPVSMCDVSSEKAEISGIRASSVDLMDQRRRTTRGVQGSLLVQKTTHKVVELIKSLIEEASNNDLHRADSTATKIQIEIHNMATVLLQETRNAEIRKTLENVLFEAFRMKFEISLLIDKPTKESTSSLMKEDNNPHQLNFVKKVKQVCFDVGAAMKNLVAVLLPME